MPNGARIHLYCLCWNDARMLPYFFRHYDDLVDEYFVYDNGSTDQSLAMLQGRDRVTVRHFDVEGDSFVDEQRRLCDRHWHNSRGKADWVIVTDIDEHLYRPNLTDYLNRCQAEGITAIRSFGYEMVTDRFPTEDDKLSNLIVKGCRSSGLDRLCIFNPDALSATHFAPGRHKAWPEGHVVWPPSSEVLLLHFKQLGVEYVTARSAELAQGIKAGDLQNGWGTHHLRTPREIEEVWSRTMAESVPVPGLGELSHISPEEYRGDEKIVEQSGLLDEDWYQHNYRDVRENGSGSIMHFCRYGWKEGRRPNFYFDPVWYESTYPHSTTGGRNPLVHYILHGEPADDWPSPHFDTGWYRQTHGLAPDESPLRHYLLRRGVNPRVSPMPNFDVDGFCHRHPEIRALGRDPYEEFVRSQEQNREHGEFGTYPTFAALADKLGLDPDSENYPATVPWGSVIALIQLFLQNYPLDEAWYREAYPDVDAALRRGEIASAFEHFIEHGYFEGRLWRPRSSKSANRDSESKQGAAHAGS